MSFSISTLVLSLCWYQGRYGSLCTYLVFYSCSYIYIKYIAGVAEWSRALDIRLDWCWSASTVWVQIPSREEQKNWQLKNLILTFLLLTLSVPGECCSTLDFECTWWMLFYFWLWVYLMNVVLLLTLSVPDECCFSLDFECTWWMLFYFWLWMYLMNVVLLLTLSVPD